MSETIGDKKIFSLLEVASSIQKTLADRYQSSYWIKAEMNKLNYYSYSGHCYPELVEKREGKIVAQIKSNLWKSDYERINAKFLETLKEPIKDGINILFCATITFDPSYGLSLRIIDIDPAFSLGELEREKQRTIEKLNEQGIFRNNKLLTMAVLPQRIAVISADSSKGYSDYLKILEQNQWGYKFFNFLFPAILQGDRSVDSILWQLGQIRKVVHHFDAVAIIRGGGGDVGLSSYNDFNLAKEIALFPLPVITGIGHSTNETVAEIVSYKNAITPTELADFLLQRFHDFAYPVRKAEEVLVERAWRILKDERLKFGHAIRYFQSATLAGLLQGRNNINELRRTLVQLSKFLIRHEQQRAGQTIQNLKKYIPLVLDGHQSQLAVLTNGFKQYAQTILIREKQSVDSLERNIEIMKPENILRRGFTITLDEKGKPVKHPSQVKAGDWITTILPDGQLKSEVKDSTKKS